MPARLAFFVGRTFSWAAVDGRGHSDGPLRWFSFAGPPSLGTSLVAANAHPARVPHDRPAPPTRRSQLADTNARNSGAHTHFSPLFLRTVFRADPFADSVRLV